LGEQKTKAAQLGLKKLLEVGVQPHIVAVRAQNPILESAKEKIAMFSNVPIANVFSMHDRKSIYTIPEALRAEGLDGEVLTRLNLHSRVNPVKEDQARDRWRGFVHNIVAPRKYQCRIGITGKYAGLRDAYASIDKALEHCGAHLSAEVEQVYLDTTTFAPEEASKHLQGLDAVIVPGGFGVRGTESKIACVRYCRENQLPYLGICLGFQMAVVEYARSVCGLGKAGSTEFDPRCPDPVIDILPEQKKIEGLGGNMRLGGKDVLIKPHTLAAHLFPDRAIKAAKSADDPFVIRERFRHRFEVDPRYIQTLEQHGLVFSGRHPQQPIMQILELPPEHHPYFIGAQFHPELTGRPLRPQPMFLGLVAAAIRRSQPQASLPAATQRWLAPPSAQSPLQTTG
jgi:CTP synthase